MKSLSAKIHGAFSEPPSGHDPNGEKVVVVSAVDSELVRLITISVTGLPAACPVSGKSLTACRGTAGRPAGQAGHWQAGLPGLPGTGQAT